MPPVDHFDLFLSYASADDNLPEPHDRWVSRFEDALRRYLRAKLGGNEPKIYFDQRMIEANHSLDEIREACRNSTLFLAISSPAYHARSWTSDELNAFIASHPQPRRLFVIELGKIDKEGLLPLRNHHMMRFYEQPTLPYGRVSMPMKPGTEAFSRQVAELGESISRQLHAVAAAEPAAS